MPADYAVTIDATNTPVADGETLDVDYTVENVGDEAGTQDVSLDINESLVTVIDDFESYADDSAFASTWVTPGASTPWELETSSPLEGAQSISPTSLNERATYPDHTTVDDQPYVLLFQRDGGFDGNPGFFIHAQDETDPFSNQIWCRLATRTGDIDLYVREDGAYNENTSAGLSESLSTGTTYRLQLETDTDAGEAIATAFNNDTDTQIGQATVPYSTAWSSGMAGLYGDPWSGTEYFDYIHEPGSALLDNADSDNVSLNASESTSGTLSWTPDAAGVGDWYAIIGSEDDSDNTQITVAHGDSTAQSATATETVGDGVSVQTGGTAQQAAASMDVYDGLVGSTSQTVTGSVSIGNEVITETDRTRQRAFADSFVDGLVMFTAVDWAQTTPHITEPDHVIKAGSDRPDFTFMLEYDGTPVDLPDAVDATVELYAPEGTQIDHGGELGGRYPAVVSYDVDADLFVGGGWYTAEIRVTFSDGDEQWFPIERPTYDIAVYPSPHDRPDDIGGG